MAHKTQDKTEFDELPIWERIAAIVAAVPPEAWEDVPADLAENHDRYLDDA